MCELYNSKEELNQKTISELCFLPRTTVNSIISGLVQQSYIKLKEDPKDKRQKIIVLTEKGNEYARPIMEHMSNSELQAFKSIDQNTIQVMLDGLQEYQKRFNDKLNNNGGKE